MRISFLNLNPKATYKLKQEMKTEERNTALASRSNKSVSEFEVENQSNDSTSCSKEKLDPSAIAKNERNSLINESGCGKEKIDPGEEGELTVEVWW